MYPYQQVLEVKRDMFDEDEDWEEENGEEEDFEEEEW